MLTVTHLVYFALISGGGDESPQFGELSGFQFFHVGLPVFTGHFLTWGQAALLGRVSIHDLNHLKNISICIISTVRETNVSSN